MFSFAAGDPGLPQGVTDKYGLRRYIRFNSHVDRAHWDDDEYALACLHRRTGRSSSHSS